MARTRCSREAHATLRAARGDTQSPPGLLNAFIAHYRDHIADESRPFPGV